MTTLAQMLLGVISDMARYAVSNPAVAVSLANDVMKVFGKGKSLAVHPQVVAAQVAGLAAARANAVQEAGRRKAKKP